MDTYNDYVKYIEEKEPIINIMKEHANSTHLLINDVITSLNFISGEKNNHNLSDPDLLELFEFGYEYLVSFMIDFEYIYNEYLKKDNKQLKKYDILMSYWYILQDLKVFLQMTSDEKRSRNIDVTEINEHIVCIDEELDKIDEIIKDNKEVSNELLSYLDEMISLFDPDHEFEPIFAIYSNVVYLLKL